MRGGTWFLNMQAEGFSGPHQQMLDSDVTRGCDHHIDVWFLVKRATEGGLAAKGLKDQPARTTGLHQVEAQSVLAVCCNGQASLSLNPFPE